MRVLSFIILLFFVANADAQNAGNSMAVRKVDSVYSKILKESRKVWVYVPRADSITVSSKQHYPVVYLLDGEAYFHSVVQRIQQLAEGNGNTVIPPVIVVGISSTD